LTDGRLATWAIEPHTEAKHALLAAYLKAWFPILSFGGFDRVIYIDGFAGPGRYSGGQDGSPILALRALAEQKVPLKATFEFHFVERDPAIAATLESSISKLRGEGLIGPKTEVYVHAPVTFEQAYDEVIRPRLLRYSSAPAFALVDPFGWTGIPMRMMGDLLSRQSTEVLINFMFEEINRFLAHKDQPANFDALFGGSDWRPAVSMSGDSRKQLIHNHYRDQLHSTAGARYVRSFEMRNARKLVDYYLFFASNSLKGLSKMKEAMWKIDPAGGFAFSDATDPNQLTIFEPEPDRAQLQRLIITQFSSKRARVSQIEAYVVEHTPFTSGHYKKVLKEMEACGALMPINPDPKRKPGTYGDSNLLLEFR
jgi:three-Cys-motif partner protein